MTIFLTIISGVSIFAFGQIVLKLIIDPVNEFKKTVSQIAHDLILYANVYANPKAPGDEKQAAMSQQMRKLSSMLHSNMYLIPAYNTTRKLFCLPKQEDVAKATKNLIGISNGYDGALANQGILNTYSAQHVKEALGIHIPEGEYLDPEKERLFIKAKDN